VAISSLIVYRFDDSIYRSQLRTRADSAASAPAPAAPTASQQLAPGTAEQAHQQAP
jgi:hypothetical protein